MTDHAGSTSRTGRHTNRGLQMSVGCGNVQAGLQGCLARVFRARYLSSRDPNGIRDTTLGPHPWPPTGPEPASYPMSSKETEDQKLSARANELYWRSGQSVNQIAEEMDLSKSRLYGLVEPLPAGSPCPECQTELLFPNRTAMEKGFVSCPDCGFESKSATNGQAAGPTPPDPQPEADQDTASAPERQRLGSKRVLWGSALLGVAAGLYIAIRQRRS